MSDQGSDSEVSVFEWTGSNWTPLEVMNFDACGSSTGAIHPIAAEWPHVLTAEVFGPVIAHKVSCPGDENGDGEIDVDDFNLVLGAWETSSCH